MNKAIQFVIIICLIFRGYSEYKTRTNLGTGSAVIRGSYTYIRGSG